MDLGSKFYQDCVFVFMPEASQWLLLLLSLFEYTDILSDIRRMNQSIWSDHTSKRSHPFLSDSYILACSSDRGLPCKRLIKGYECGH